MGHKKTVIYCFSGTGNCLALARMVGDRLGNTEINGIMTLLDKPEIPEEYDRVGFSIPTCFSHPPKIVTEICEKIVFTNYQKVFVMVTCGGGNIHTLPDLLRQLQPKTDNRIQGFSVSLPGNHIVGFGAWSERRQRKMFLHSEKKADQIAQMIEERTATKPQWEPPEPIAGRFQQFLNEQMLGVPDIHSTANHYYVTSGCIRCGVCEKICPVGNVKLSEGGVEFGDNCQQCMACIQWCPKRTIAHPNVPQGRKRYHHPDITIDDMIALNSTS